MNNKIRTVITGIGVLASNGLNKEEFMESILNGKSGLNHSEFLENLNANTEIAGQINLNEKLDKNQDKNLSLSYKVFDEALSDSRLTREEINSLGLRAGISYSTSIAGNSNIVQYLKNESNITENECNLLINCPSYMQNIVKYTGVMGPSYSTVSACAAGTAGAGIAFDLIRYNKADIVIVIGAECLNEFSVAGFHSLKNMSKTGCSPFDKNRDGVSLGEGAAALIFESLEHALNRNAKIYGEILGYGIGNEAYHITTPNPNGDGAYNSMNMALEDSNISIQDIDYINPHGTGTFVNDSMEIKALAKLYDNQEKRALISSTKSFTGHCLGAAGSIELALSFLAIDKEIVPSNTSLENLDDEFKEYKIVGKECMIYPIDKVMSNSFAFGGNTASMIIGKYK